MGVEEIFEIVKQRDEIQRKDNALFIRFMELKRNTIVSIYLTFDEAEDLIELCRDYRFNRGNDMKALAEKIESQVMPKTEGGLKDA